MVASSETAHRAATMRATPPSTVPRVVVTGGESTGKTTLAMQLAVALSTTWVPEFSRTYAEQLQRPLTSDDVSAIASGQRAAEDAAIEAWTSVHDPNADWPPLILDTDLVSTTVYAEHYYGACPSWIVEAARERLAPLYLLCEPDLPWLPDGVRDRPEARRQLHRSFLDRLHDFGAHVVPVAGAGANRLEVALAGVRGWRAARVSGHRD